MDIIIDIPKKENFGEDAPPINLEVSLKNRIISVFDGLGGSGSTIYEENGEYYLAPLDKVVDITAVVKEFVKGESFR